MSDPEQVGRPPEAQRLRPFRFCVQASHMSSPEDLLPLARKAEDLGVSVLTVADHLDDQLSPFAALTAAADATSTLRVGTLVLSNDFRHPAMTAKEAATVDRLSGGRLELGLGAGWMVEDYRSTGIRLDRPGVRIERLDEALGLIRSLWSGEPVDHHGTHYDIDGLVLSPMPMQRGGPPLWVGGGGRKVLEVAARRADVIHLNPALPAGVIDHRAGPTATAAATETKLGWIREAAGERFAGIELGTRIHLAFVTGRATRSTRSSRRRSFGLDAEEAKGSPHALCGTVEQIVEDLLERRERFGISNIGISASATDQLAPVIARLVASSTRRDGGLLPMTWPVPYRV
ncbi:MAG: TIGR03621 family F420-dependent LLM class oxidoreductase [Microthrixaceae bacterium]